MAPENEEVLGNQIGIGELVPKYKRDAVTADKASDKIGVLKMKTIDEGVAIKDLGEGLLSMLEALEATCFSKQGDSVVGYVLFNSRTPIEKIRETLDDYMERIFPDKNYGISSNVGNDLQEKDLGFL